MTRHRDVYREVTDRIVEQLEAGTVPWRQPILGGERGWPANLASGKDYRGLNVFLLAVRALGAGYRSRFWLTFRQTAQRGGHIRRGEKGSLVVFYKMLETRDRETGEPTTVPVLRHYHVWNLEQTEGLDLGPEPAQAERRFTPIEAAERIVAGFEGGPAIEYGGDQALYRPRTDTVKVPKPERFFSDELFYGTLFHELSHATGHSSRLDRGLDTQLQPFGSPDYTKEELLAELGAAFLCGIAGIAPATLEDSASYINGWLSVLKKDKRFVVQAAGGGQRAADWVLGQREHGRQRT